jgi:hypothetical protein
MPLLERRALTFAALDEIVEDAERLRDHGCDAVGRWDLAQACDHLAEWMRFPLDGFPPAPLPIRGILWVMRHTVAKGFLRRAMSGSGMPTGGATDPRTVFPAGNDPVAAVAKLTQTVERLKASHGPFHPSPLFGSLDKEALVKLNLAHASLHLSFLIPRG